MGFGLRIEPTIVSDVPNVDSRNPFALEHGNHGTTWIRGRFSRSGLQELLEGDGVTAGEGFKHNERGDHIRIIERMDYSQAKTIRGGDIG